MSDSPAAPTPRRPARDVVQDIFDDLGLLATPKDTDAAVARIEADRALAPVQGDALAEMEELRARLKELEAELSFWQDKHAIASFRASDAEDALAEAATQPPAPPVGTGPHSQCVRCKGTLAYKTTMGTREWCDEVITQAMDDEERRGFE